MPSSVTTAPAFLVPGNLQIGNLPQERQGSIHAGSRLAAANAAYAQGLAHSAHHDMPDTSLAAASALPAGDADAQAAQMLAARHMHAQATPVLEYPEPVGNGPLRAAMLVCDELVDSMMRDDGWINPDKLLTLRDAFEENIAELVCGESSDPHFPTSPMEMAIRLETAQCILDGIDALLDDMLPSAAHPAYDGTPVPGLQPGPDAVGMDIDEFNRMTLAAEGEAATAAQQPAPVPGDGSTEPANGSRVALFPPLGMPLSVARALLSSVAAPDGQHGNRGRQASVPLPPFGAGPGAFV